MPSAAYDVTVIGAGTAGKHAARQGALAGARTAIVEKAQFGGTCLNRGCIPKKTLVGTVDLLWRARKAGSLGLTGTERLGVDWGTLIARKGRIVADWREGYAEAFRSQGINVFEGSAVFADRHRLRIGEAELTSGTFVVAAGSVPVLPDIPGSEHALTSDGILELREPPPRLIVIGGGVVAMEFAFAFARSGSRVTVLESQPRILAALDPEIRELLVGLAAGAGIRTLTGVRVTGIDSQRTVVAEVDGASLAFPGDAVLLAVGRKADIEGLEVWRTGAEADSSGLRLNCRLQSVSAPHVFGAGDAAGRFQLTSVAWYEGQIAGRNAAGTGEFVDYDLLPTAVFTIPPVAMVGLTEASARERGIDVTSHRLSYSGNTVAALMEETDGMIKLVARSSDDRILGAQILGARAEDLIHIVAVAIRGGLTRRELGSTLYAFPTLSGLVFDVAAG